MVNLFYITAYTKMYIVALYANVYALKMSNCYIFLMIFNMCFIFINPYFQVKSKKF